MSQTLASPTRSAARLRRHRLLAAAGALLVALFVLVEVLLLQSYAETERTTRDFRGTTDAATTIANAQRESLLLAQAVTSLRPGDPLAPVVIKRGLLERQVNVIERATPDNRALLARVRRIRARAAEFDAAFAAAYGRGARAQPGPGQAKVRRVLEQLDVEVKETFDEQEHVLYDALGLALHERARGELLIVGLSVVALLGAAGLALVMWRAIRGDFALAYRMLDRSEARLRRLVEQLPAIVYSFALDDEGRPAAPVYVSPQAKEIIELDVDASSPDVPRLAEHVPAEDRGRIAAEIAAVAAGGSPRPVEFRFRKPSGEEIWLRDGGAAVTDGPDGRQLHGLLFDITAAKRAEAERERMELELRLAQKLEAVGQLAAGIAHEINTPIQFVGDTMEFLEGAFRDLMELQAAQDELHRISAAGLVPAELVEHVRQSKDDADLDYLRERVPAAVERAGDGIRRVGVIVKAMREFAHPPTSDHTPFDLNEALRNTLIVAASEYRYVADVDTEFGDLPLVTCNGGDVNQVFLNLIVNAAHAIEDVGAADGRGTITVRTRREGEHALVSIGDTGCGIPSEVAGRVFDPFFTTKEVGRGTGQGLAIARSLVVERHSGTLTFETTPGQGTTFHVRLPIGAEGARSGSQSLAGSAT